MMNLFPLRAIGFIRSPFPETAGTPIQSVMAQGIEGSIDVFPEFVAGLQDLAGFDRIWLLYWFDRASQSRLVVTPFLDQQARGIFATRSPVRPNPIGLSCVRLLGVENGRLRIADVDVLDQTPLLDIKPYVPAFDVFPAERIGWLAKQQLERTVADSRFNRNPA